MKNCPFCNAAAELDASCGYRSVTGKLGRRTVVFCRACEAEISVCHEDRPGYSREEIIDDVTDRWNTRKPTTEAVETPFVQKWLFKHIGTGGWLQNISWSGVFLTDNPKKAMLVEGDREEAMRLCPKHNRCSFEPIDATDMFGGGK